MTHIKLIWEAAITNNQSLYNNCLNMVIASGLIGSTAYELLKDANHYINEFGYSVIILCTVGALLLKYIELRHKIRKHNGS